MAKITDPRKKKKVKVTRQKVGPAPDRSGDGATINLDRGKRTVNYKETEVQTGHQAYGPESKTKDSPEFVKRARAAKQEIAYKDGLPYRAGHRTETKEPDKITTRIKVTPDIRPVKTTVEYGEDQTSGRKAKKGRKVRLKPRRMVAGGEDKKGNPATKYGVGRGKGFKARRTKSSKRPGGF